MNRYDKVDPTYILGKWEENVNPIGVYIHSPFCPSICKFCIYNGILKTNEEYVDYYETYLPKVISFYKPVLEKKQDSITSWFFGGGTPSMMSADTLRKVLDQLPNFKESTGLKTFEIHPAYWSDELLDVLQEYRFDIGVICLQSFDRQTLVNQKRVPATPERVKQLADSLRSRGMKIYMDVISFLNANPSDVGLLASDLEQAYTDISPDEISVQTIYQSKAWTCITIDKVFASKFGTSGEYVIEGKKNTFIEFKDASKEELSEHHMDKKCFRLFKKATLESNSKEFVNYMDANYKTEFPVDTLAIGAYKNSQTQTHSNISHFNYIEHNLDNTEPTFRFVRASFFDEARKLLDIMEKYGEPPADFELTFKNNMYGIREVPLMLSWWFTGHDINVAENIQADIDTLNNINYYKLWEKA